MGSIRDTIEGLFKKANDTEARYKKALENKEVELLELKAELQEKEFMLKDMHKMKLLGDISESAYDTEKEKVDRLKTKVQEAEQELELIQVYKTDDIKAIHDEMEANKQEIYKEETKEIYKLQYDLQQAKLDYLKKLAEAGKAYQKAKRPNSLFENIKEKIGKKRSYDFSGAEGSLNAVSYSSSHYGVTSLRVDQQDVYDALNLGQLPSQTVYAVELGKKNGHIK
ncbi:hypothetical protein [Niallia taxi]|uniref:hypothetical protein n=1 Tax=Niallia taxi TaxID=2499688 RepID=UPI002E223018|nr:hypothetical protein [Niallia taxi]